MTIDAANIGLALLGGLVVIVGVIWKLFDTLGKAIERIEHIAQMELTTNGDKPDSDHTSLLDKVDAQGEQLNGLQSQVTDVRDSLTDQHSELTDHIGDVKDKASKLEAEAEATSAAWIKWMFEHGREHTDIFVWLKDQFGLDRRRKDPRSDP